MSPWQFIDITDPSEYYSPRSHRREKGLKWGGKGLLGFAGPDTKHQRRIYGTGGA